MMDLRVVLFVTCLFFPAGGRPLLPHKPDPAVAAASARWLVSENYWGVLSTISNDIGGSPFGNVVSFSDGLPGAGKGLPYFYLTSLDPTARNALKDARSSLTVSEYPIGTCGKTDPENPTCAKLTLIGKLKLVDIQSTEAEFARIALFAKHGEMKDWPKNHNFQIFKLDIEDIFLINQFGGPKPLTPAQYFSYKMRAANMYSRLINKKKMKQVYHTLEVGHKFLATLPYLHINITCQPSIPSCQPWNVVLN